MKRSTENWIIGSLAVSFFAYVAARAWLLPITHDEGATLLNHVPRLVYDTLTFKKEANPNNHILNTLGIKILLGIFPGHQFVARLPVLIGCAMYIWASIGICRRLSEQTWVRLFGIIVLLANPFLAEFFALARGYGLAIGLMMMALYYTWRFFENNAPRTLRATLIFAGLAVYANFTLLLFFGPFVLLVFWAACQQNRSWTHFWPVVRPAFYTLGIYVLLWIAPLNQLSKDHDLVHWEQLSSDFETVRMLMRSSTHGHAFLGNNTMVIFSWAALVAMLIGWGMAIWQWSKQKWQFAKDPKVFLAAVFMGAVIANVANVHLLHTAQLNDRLSLFFYPLFALLLASMAAWLWQQIGKRTWIFLAPVLLITLINNVRCINLRESFEWRFDASTFEVLNKIKEIQIAEGHTEPYSFDGSWVILNSFIVHINQFPQGYNHVLQEIKWHPDRPAVAGPDFFFATYEGEVQALGDNYQMIYKPFVGYLLRKK